MSSFFFVFYLCLCVNVCRGGIPELIRLIKSTKVPIVCVCNDRLSQKVRTLASHCFDLKLRRPTKGQIARRMKAIADYEGLKIEQEAIELLSESSGNDIRQVLHAMEMLRRSSTASVSTQEMRARLRGIEKDSVLRTTPTEAAVKIMMDPRLLILCWCMSLMCNNYCV